MLIKKPYAFIIKYFKYIHMVFFLLLLYITYKYFNILKFFNDYIKTGYYNFYESLSGYFVNYYLFISIIVVIIFCAFLYLMMKEKKKKTRYYFITVIFYLVIFAFTIFLFNTLKTLELKTLDIRNVRVIRDLLIIISFPQIYFTVFAFLRAIGFDIKSFNFKKDLEEIDITEEDEEIIEVFVPKENYKFMRRIRRFIRETKYFALEYKFFFLVIVIISLFSLFLTLYLNIEVYNKKYNENEKFISESMKYTVKDSYITTVDYGGNIINKNKSYIIVKLNIENLGMYKKRLNLDKLKLIVNNEELRPTLSKRNYFVDIAKPYNNQSLNPNEEYEYLIIYEINNKFRNNNYIFRIFNDVKYISGEINSINKDVIIYPENLDNLEGFEKYEINNEISLGESNLDKLKIKIKKFDINNSFEEIFDYCVEGKCYKGIKKVTPYIISSIPKSIIRLECDFEIDEDKYIKKEVNNALNFISYFGSIYYTIGDISKISQIKALKNENINNSIVFFEVPEEVINAESIKLYITIRNIRYIITLK